MRGEGQEVRDGAEHQECAGQADHRAPAAADDELPEHRAAPAGPGPHVQVN